MILGTISNKIINRLKHVSFGVADNLVSSRIVEQFRSSRYRRDLAAHRKDLPTIGGCWPEIVGSLKRNGIVQRDITELGLAGGKDLIAAGKALISHWQGQLLVDAQAGRKFLQVPAAAIAQLPEIYRFGLSQPLLAAVEDYLGLPVAYDGVTLQFTVADGEAVATREWHRDREDRRMVKLAIYLNDVDAHGGPFQLLHRPAESLQPFRGRDQYHLDTDRIESAMAAGKISAPLTCEGATGTAVFADTAMFFHRGKPVTGRHRAALFFSYFACNPKRPYYCNRSGFSRREIDRITADLSPVQRRAALWHSALPLYWRVIPSASTR